MRTRKPPPWRDSARRRTARLGMSVSASRMTTRRFEVGVTPIESGSEKADEFSC